MAIATVNPTTAETERVIEPHTDGEVEEHIAQAVKAAQQLRNTSFTQRAEWMNTAADILTDQVKSLGELITIEMGKPIAQSVAEVEKCAKVMRFYAEHAEEFLADSVLDDPAKVTASRAWTRYEP